MEDPVADQIEDELFYADLSRQISLLIMDEDEDLVSTHDHSVSIKDYSSQVFPPPTTQYPYLYEPAACRRESKGTGVFIPSCSSHPTIRINKQGRSKPSKIHKQPHSSRGLPQLSYNNSYIPKKVLN